MTRWLRRRSYQTRVSTLVVAAVGVAIALVSIASYFAVSHQLYRQVDQNLSADYRQLLQSASGDGRFLQVNEFATQSIISRSGVMIQQIDESRHVVPAADGQAALPPDAVQVAVCDDPVGTVLIDTATVRGQDYRFLTTPTGADPQVPGRVTAAQLVESLAPTERTLAALRLILVAVMIGGLAAAVLLGLTVARAALRPIKRLTAAAEHVATTQQLDATIAGEADDELGRLATAFNRMLAALGASRRQQAQLVSDAGHELRTPLTSLTTNVELLTKADRLPDADRRELLSDIHAQLGELATLVGDLVELARQDEQQPEPIEVRLDAVVERGVVRAQRRAPSVRFDVDLTPGSVRAQPPLLERAVLNVLDNAAKWSPPGGTVEVRLNREAQWVLEVRDHGPGIAPEDRPKVFDRFFRAPSARSMPGSGLGLAIVRQVVTTHGGSVGLVDVPGGGTLVRIELPIVVEEEPGVSDGVPRPGQGAPAAEPDSDSDSGSGSGSGSEGGAGSPYPVPAGVTGSRHVRDLRSVGDPRSVGEARSLSDPRSARAIPDTGSG